MRSAEDEAVSLREELRLAKDEVAAGRAAFGEHHATITLHADSLGELDARVAEVMAMLADLGMVGVREDIALEPAFWAQFPGNFRYIGRRALVSARNFAGLASLHNFPVGSATGNHWGEAVTLFETTAAGPYFFNFHQNDLGNFTIIGPSGSGKTVVLNFLLAQARKFAPASSSSTRIAAPNCSSARSAAATTSCAPVSLGPQSAPVARYPGQPPVPDRLADAARRRCRCRGSRTHPRGARGELRAAPAFRRLRTLVELFRGYDRPHAADLWSRLRPWWGDGERAWLFDNAEDHTDLPPRRWVST
jgi:type IV secretion system protein VirB4